VLLADEINRATPKTQSALLEAMQERSVTAGGETHILEEPFLVLATQNPLEMEGTYPLPEAQLDRFLLKLLVKPQDRDDLLTILRRTTGESLPDPEPVLTRDELLSHARLVRRVATAPHVEDFVVRLVLATQPGHALAPEPVRKYVRYGSSPRGAQALLLAAKVVALLDRRYHVAFEDVEKVARAALRHRLLLGFEADTDGVTADTLLEAVLEAVPRAVE
jgi:MoxR-like ATPase